MLINRKQIPKENRGQYKKDRGGGCIQGEDSGSDMKVHTHLLHAKGEEAKAAVCRLPRKQGGFLADAFYVLFFPVKLKMRSSIEFVFLLGNGWEKV